MHIKILFILLFISGSTLADTYRINTDCSDPLGATLHVNGSGQAGTLIFMTGGPGDRLWSNSTASAKAINRLQGRGFQTVQVVWRKPGWMDGSEGLKEQACRPAQVIDWVYQNLYTKGCFAGTGNSAGGTQLAYAISHYGQGEILDAVVFTGGPPKSLSSGGDYNHPDVAFRFIFGDRDHTTAVEQGIEYMDNLESAGSTNIKWKIVEGVGHGVHKRIDGAKLIVKALTYACR